MIPTLILFGLVFGRWWRAVLLVAALGWPVVVLGEVSGVGLVGAAVLGVVNAGVGVGVHQGVLWVVRRQRAAAVR